MGTKNDPGEFDCYAGAHPDEPIFVLRSTDPQAPWLVRLWVGGYLRRVADAARDPDTPVEELLRRLDKAREALELSEAMAAWRPPEPETQIPPDSVEDNDSTAEAPPDEGKVDGPGSPAAAHVAALSEAYQLRKLGYSWERIALIGEFGQDVLLEDMVGEWATADGLEWPPGPPTDKISRAYRLRVEGLSWNEIASQVGYSSNAACASVAKMAKSRGLPWPIVPNENGESE